MIANQHTGEIDRQKPTTANQIGRGKDCQASRHDQNGIHTFCQVDFG